MTSEQKQAILLATLRQNVKDFPDCDLWKVLLEETERDINGAPAPVKLTSTGGSWEE